MTKSKKPKSPSPKAAARKAAKAPRSHAPAKAKAKADKRSKPAAKEAPSKAKPAAAALRSARSTKARGLLRAKSRPEAFSLDEVLEIAKANSSRKHDAALSPEVQAAREREAAIEARFRKAATPHHVQAASLADILGYNPAKHVSSEVADISKIEPRFQKYYKLLIQLRNHVQAGLSEHAEETLKRSSKEDAGDLSGYGQHMADAGTDTFDRDFALSLVSSEQEALTEIEAAIKRINEGTYGVC